MKSASSSTPPNASKHLKRSRLLRRGCDYQPLEGEHIKYLWAAYRRGALPWPEGLGAEQFRNRVIEITEAVVEKGGDVYVLLGDTPLGRIPVGVAAVDVMEGPNVRRQAMPHAWWFPEASPRHRLECSVKFLVDLKKEQNLLIIAEEANWRFFAHLSKYGVVRPIGKYWSYLENGDDVMLYQGVNSSMKK